MDKENLFYKKCKLMCNCNQKKNQQSCVVTQRRHCKYQDEDLLDNLEQRKFISFLTDIVCIIAFIFFGSVIFWLAITRICIDCLKKIHNSDRCTKIFAAGLFTIILLSITTHILLNKNAWKHQLNQDKIELTRKNDSVVSIPSESLTIPSPSEPEYLKVTLKDKHLRNLINDNKTDTSTTKKFTMTIVDERKKEVFKTSKDFLIPELPLEIKGPPSLIVSLTDIILENY